MEYVATRLPRSVINTTLKALSEGGTVCFEAKELPAAYQKFPAKLALEFNKKTGIRIFVRKTRAGIMFIREYDA